MNIIMYGQPGCMPCHMLRMKMMDDKLQFEYRDVRNQVYQQEMLEASGGIFMTPTVVVGDAVMLNPDLQTVKSAISE